MFTNDLENDVYRFLTDYEFPPQINGYRYLKEGLVHILNNRDEILSNKILFAHLSDKFNVDLINIERCIRTIIDKMWVDLVRAGMFNDRPTPRQFILKCVECITSGSHQKSAYDILLS